MKINSGKQKDPKKEPRGFLVTGDDGIAGDSFLP